jgi:hypothetical protein
MIAVVRLILLAAALTFGVKNHARADGVHVDTQIDPCVPLDRERFVYLLGIELGAAPATPTESAATLTLSCSDNLIELSVQDALTQKVVSRSVDITTVDPNNRERLMALTASELVIAGFLEVGMESGAAIPPAGSAPKQPVSEVASARLPRAPPLRLGADLTTATFLSAAGPIFGLAVHLSQPFSRDLPSWSWNLSLLGGRGSLDGTLANQQVAVSVTTAALAGSARYTRAFAALDLWVGLAGLVGMAYLRGSPAGMLKATPAYGPWAGPALQLGAAYSVSQRVRLLLQLEAGVLLLGTRALVAASSETDVHVVLALHGGWLGANLGFDCAL